MINITGGNDITLFEVDEAANKIRAEVDPSAEILVGTTFDDALAGKLRVSIVATGLNGEVSANKPVVSMIRHIQNRNNGYTKPSAFSGSSYSSVQSTPHMATHGATAFDMSSYPHAEEQSKKQENFDVSKNYEIEEEKNNETSSQQQADEEHLEMKIDENSLFSQSDPIEFVEESLEKIENETQLFTNDQEINSSISKQENLNSDNHEKIVNENFSDLESEDKSDLEIPAFLRRQTN